MKQRILVAGGAGYIGSVLCGFLLDAGHHVTCVDRFFFGEKTIDGHKQNANFTIRRADTRHLLPGDFKDIDIVIDLAGLSNDPSCDLDKHLTEEINVAGALTVANAARAAGVTRLIYASSCSVYGDAGVETVQEASCCNPVSLYARSKLQVEQSLLKMASEDFCVIIPRLATVYGVSPRMRFDLIINCMTSVAYNQRRIIVLGGGRQWRPLVHIRDVCAAFSKLLNMPAEAVNGEIINIGDNRQNYRVIDVARHVQDIVPGVSVDVANDDPDKRSYHVDFSKAAALLKFEACYDMISGIREVLESLRDGTTDMADPRTSTLRYYKYLIDAENTLSNIRLNGKVF